MILETSLTDAVIQIAHLENISGDFTGSVPFMVKNISSSAITLSVQPVKNDAAISTVIPPYTWEPIVCAKVYEAPENTIQIGY